MSTITVNSLTLKDWHRSDVTELRVFCLAGFTASSGQYVPNGSPSEGPYLSLTCTYDSGGNTLTIPSFTIDSTTDGLDIVNATYSAYFYDTSGALNRAFQGFDSFEVPAVPTSTTWKDIRLFNQGSPIAEPDTFYTKLQVNQLIAGITTGFMSNPLTTLGDTIYGGASGTPSRLGGNTTSTKQFFTQTGTGSASATPTWGSVVASDITSGTFSIAQGGTNSSTALNNGRLMVSSGGALVERAALSTSQFLVGDATNGVTSFGMGSGNQLLGVNSGGTTYEYKTLVAGTNVTITHGSGTVQFDVSGAGSGSVTSVAMTVPSFLSVSGSPITSSGTLAVSLSGTAIPIANGGTNSTSALSNGRLMISSGSAIVERSALTSSALTVGDATNGVTSLALGTANQLLGMNSGASANEYKSLAVGTSGTDFAIAHSANTVTFNLPDASASNRGAVTTGTQTIAGAKTFSSALVASTSLDAIIKNSTKANLPTPGSRGRLYYQTDDKRGLVVDNGTNWFTGSTHRNVMAYGAKLDGKLVGDASVTNGSPNLASAAAGFVSTDVGKVVIVQGAGAAGANLTTTIATFVDASHVTMTASASTTVSPANCYFGTDDTSAIQAAIDSFDSSGGILDFPSGKTIVSSTLTLGDGTTTTLSSKNNIKLRGAGGGRIQFAINSGASELWWASAAGTGPIIQVDGPYSNFELSGFFIDAKVGTTAANTAVLLNHVHRSKIDDLCITNHAVLAIDLATRPLGIAGANVGADDNVFSRLWLQVPSVTTGGGIRLGAAATTSYPSSRTHVSDSWIYAGSNSAASAINIRYGDTLSFSNITTSTTGSGVGLRITATTDAVTFPQGISFYNCALKGNTAVSGTWTPPDRINFWPYDKADGETTPTDPGFMGVDDRGHFFGSSYAFDGLVTSGGASLLTFTPAANTAITAEVKDYDFASHTNTITGGYTTQRFACFSQPTITAASALTVTNAATLAIAAAPTTAGSAVITNKYALWVQAGMSQLDGNVTSPILYGGSAAGSSLSLQATSNGSPSNAHIISQSVSGSTQPGGFFIGAPTSSYLGAGDTLHLQGPDTAGSQITADNYVSAAAVGPFLSRHARGSAASPSQVLADDNLVSLQGAGYHSGGAFANPTVAITARAAEAFTSTAQGTYIRLLTATVGTTTATDRIRVQDCTSLYKGSDVASAATIYPTGNTFHVTGTTNITSVGATMVSSTGPAIIAGTTIQIIFDGALTFTDGSNLKLAGNFVTTTDDTITLVYDGTSWFELCRSVN